MMLRTLAAVALEQAAQSITELVTSKESSPEPSELS